MATSRVTVGLLACAVGLVAALIFLPHLNAGFVSDTFFLLEAVKSSPFSALPAQFIPSSRTWYRPMTNSVYWLEYRFFGRRPLGYHVISVLCHVTSSALIVLLSRRMTGDTGAAFVAGIIFLFTLHAHEVVFDVADVHHALGGVALLGCVLAYATGYRVASMLLAGFAMTVYETGMLSLPLVGLYELVFGIRSVDRPAIAASARRLAPFAVLFAAYVLLRSLIGGAWKNEVVPCWTAKCLAVAVLEYINRLFVRPEALRSVMWSHRPALAIASLTIVAAVLALLRPWMWRRWRATLLGAGWLVGTTLFFILTLFPYVSDRFVYVPDMGFALCLGAIVAESRFGWPRAPAGARGALVIAAGAATLWIATGALMLSTRGYAWDRAGARARAIFEGTVALVPDPPPNTTFVFHSIPDSDSPDIAPGNTGPYVFRNGLDSALRLQYGRSDIRVRQGETGGAGEIVLAIEGHRVRLAK